MTEALSNILSRIDSSLPALTSCRLVSLWTEIVDERVKKHTEAVKVRNKVLYVATSSPAWAQELTFLKMAIIDKFNEKAGLPVIRDIKFKCNSGGLFNG